MLLLPISRFMYKSYTIKFLKLMKLKLSILILVSISLYGCYEVPDDFPKADFYSYAPYHKDEMVYFISESDTITYVISNVSEWYNRGKTTCKCGKESVHKDVTFSQTNVENGAQDFNFYIYCGDRAYFNMSLQSHSDLYALNASYTVDYGDEDPWAPSFDESKIFKEFIDDIILTQNDLPTAEVKKGHGLLWFVDASGRRWNSLQR